VDDDKGQNILKSRIYAGERKMKTSVNTKALLADPNCPEKGVIVVRPSQQTMSRQGLPQFVGISEDTVGAKGISMQLVVIPPGGVAEPHIHASHETAIYMVQGRVETHFVPGLRQSVVCEVGDFIYIGPGVPHQPVNLSATDQAIAIVARNDPKEQEHVFSYDPAVSR
jgi:uncharacterized RmlC-like cupin family protein